MRSDSAMRCLLAVVCLSGVWACGGDDGAPLVPRTGGNKRDSGPADSDAGAGDGGTIQANPNAPNVQIISPAAAADPNDDTVITTETVSVRCRVAKAKTAAARDVNLTSVRIMLINPEDEMHPIAGVVAAQPDDEFEAEFKLTDSVNGRWKLRCEADDMNKPVLTGRATIETFIDLGPTVALIDPVDGSAHRLLGNVAIKFRVREAALSPRDTESTPTAISLTVSGVDFDFNESPDDPGLYTSTVNFDDRKLYPMPPTTAEIVVTAESSRTPEAPTRRAQAQITIDSAGPTIVVKSPGDGDLVRSDVTLVLQISDVSGVATDTVSAAIKLENEDFVLRDWAVTAGVYTEQFDTRSFDPTLTQLTITIEAEDTVGNKTTQGLTIRIDNVPPLISLDPPPMREYRVANGAIAACSNAFDPVGRDAASDLDKVLDFSLYRAIVEDRTNVGLGQGIGYIAGVDIKAVELFAQPNAAVPLLVDADKDPNHICDEINDRANGNLAESEQATPHLLEPVADKGSAYYSIAPDFGPDEVGTGCQVGTAESPPPTLCGATALTRVVPQQIDSNNPPTAIFAWMPTNTTTGACNGDTWDISQIVPGGEGWVCLAARAKDTIGNIGVSRPIRVCIDDLQGTPLCDPAVDTPPSCTDGCVPPPDFPVRLVPAK